MHDGVIRDIISRKELLVVTASLGDAADWREAERYYERGHAGNEGRIFAKQGWQPCHVSSCGGPLMTQGVTI